jgi:hypothetical protein
MTAYMATSYHYSRTMWPGIRGGLKGYATDYAILCSKRLFKKIITFGYLIPHSQIQTHKSVINNSYFGNAEASFKGGINTQNLFQKLNCVFFPRFTNDREEVLIMRAGNIDSSGINQSLNDDNIALGKGCEMLLDLDIGL